MTAEERLAQIEQTLARMEERQTGHFKRVEDHLARTVELERIVYGTPGHPGLRVDVALIKAGAERLRWIGKTAVGTGIAAVIAGVAAWVKKS